MSDPVTRTALTVELLATRLSDKAIRVSNEERDAICAALAAHSPKIRRAFRHTDAFPLWFTIGVLTLLASALTISEPRVAAPLLVIGTTTLGASAIHLWRLGWQTLDLVIGAYLTAREE